MFHYWIQRHDYSIAREEHKVSLRDAIEAFENFDWGSELAIFNEDDVERNCPPGIGFHNGYERSSAGTMLLHICLKDADTVFFSFHHSLSVDKKMFGLLKDVKEDVNQVADFPRDKAPELIRWFFTGRTDWIVETPESVSS